MFFGIFGKFRIDIGVQKKSRLFFEMIFFVILLIKGIIKIPIEFGDFSKNFKNFPKLPKTYFSRKFFHLEKKISKFFWTPMSIRNFPKIPKIILIKSREQAKAVKNQDSKFFNTECHFLVSFGSVLRITTLNFFATDPFEMSRHSKIIYSPQFVRIRALLFACYPARYSNLRWQ